MKVKDIHFRRQLGKERCIFIENSAITDRNEFDEILRMDLILVRKNAAAHDIEHHIGKMMGSAKSITGDLQTICAGNDLLKVQIV